MSNTFTFSCLVQGTSLDKYFKITIDKNKDVSELKEAIWDKKKNTFSNIDANDLILWKVNIPVSDKEKFKQLDESTIEDVLGGTKIDDATDEIKDVYNKTPNKKHIHIIIENPITTTYELNQETQSLSKMYLKGM
jgi:hypothetical protein